MYLRNLLRAGLVIAVAAPVGAFMVPTAGASALTPVSSRLVIGEAGAQPDAAIDSFVVSASGEWAAFSSAASNLVEADNNGVSDVFVMKISTGAITRVSVDASGAELSEESTNPSLCGNGRYVAFETDQDIDFLNDINFAQDIYVVDRDADGNARYDEFSKEGGVTSLLMSMGSSGLGSTDGASNPAISADCRWVSFDTADALEDIDVNSNSDVYIHSTAAADTTYDADGVITATVNVLLSQGLASDDGGSGYLSTLSENGELVAFYTRGIDLVEDEGGRQGAVMINRDADDDDVLDEEDAGAVTREYISANDAGDPSAGDPDDSAPMAMTPDGNCIAFKFTTGNDLDSESGISASNGIYLRNRDAQTTRIVSYAPVGGVPLSASDASTPQISSDCKFVAFDSGDSSLMAEDANLLRDVLLHDVDRARTFLITRTAAGATSDGTSVAVGVGTATGDGTVPVYVLSDASTMLGTSSGSEFERPFRLNYNVIFPNAPRDVAASVRAGFARQVGISWKAPIGSESLEYAGYKLLYRCGASGQASPCNGRWNSLGFTQVSDSAAHTSSTTFSNQYFTLPVGVATKSVSVSVRAVLNDADNTTGRSASSTVTPIDAPTLVATPLALSALTAASATKPITIKISSTVVSALNGSAVTSYTVDYSLNQSTWTAVSAPTGGWKLNSSVKTVTGLKAKTKYYVRLSVATTAGTVTKILSITTK